MRTRVAAAAAALFLPLAGAPATELPPPVDVRAAFRTFDPAYDAKRKAAATRLAPLARAVFASEAAGAAMPCAHQVLTQARWRLSNSADFAALDRDLARLDDLLAGRERPPPEEPDPDGASGRCYGETFLRLDATYDRIEAEAAARGREPSRPVPSRPVPFLERWNDPDRLAADLLSSAEAAPAATGLNPRRILNVATADLMRLILRDEPPGFAWRPDVRDRLLALLRGPLRDPETGFWGVLYRIAGTERRMLDLSLTFHVARYLDGRIDGWPKLLDTLLAIRDRPYPQGWIEDGRYENHHNYDVVALFGMGWPHARDDQRAAMRDAVRAMLDWCLAHSVSPDGAVAPSPADDSLETADYFAVSFFDEVGFLSPAKRFWTDDPLPDPTGRITGLRSRIEAALAAGSGGEGGVYHRNALAKLNAAEAAAQPVGKSSPISR